MDYEIVLLHTEDDGRERESAALAPHTTTMQRQTYAYTHERGVENTLGEKAVGGRECRCVIEGRRERERERERGRGKGERKKLQ